MTELLCPGCERTNHIPGDKFCFKCGTALVNPKKSCPCGRELQQIDDFCPSCGRDHRVRVETVAARNERLNAELSAMPYEGRSREETEEIR